MMLEFIGCLDAHEGALMVVITLIYVIATVAICVANLRSAKATREQLKEIKRQYEEDHRAYISYEFIYENRTWYGLRFTNQGKRVATDVQINLDEEFIDSITEPGIKESLRRIKGKTFLLGHNQSYDIFFGGDAFRERSDKKLIIGTVEYKDRSLPYSTPFEINFANYPPVFTVETDGEKIAKSLKELKKSVSAISKEIRHLASEK